MIHASTKPYLSPLRKKGPPINNALSVHLGGNDAFVEKDNRILLVEDDEEMLDYVRSILSPCFEVLIARNGAEAIRMHTYQTFDLIVSDITMPEMDGFDLLRRIRETNQEVKPFLFLTARTEKKELLYPSESGLRKTPIVRQYEI